MTRTALPLIVVVLLAGASAWSVAHAVADETVADVSRELFEIERSARSQGAVPTQEAISRLENEVARANALAPYNGYYWDANARVRFTPRLQGAVTQADMPGAYRATQRGVVVQPSSGYQWGSLLYAADQLNQSGILPGDMAALEQSLQQAARLASREPHVLKNVLDVGFANWDRLSPASQASVKTAIDHLAAREPDNTLLIAIRRGQVAVVCEDRKLTTHRACVAARQVVAAPV